MDNQLSQTDGTSRPGQSHGLWSGLLFQQPHGSWVRRGSIVGIALLLAFPCIWPNPADADDAADSPLAPVARFITLTSPVEDDQIGFVKQTAHELRAEADRDGRKAYLVLQIPAGTTQFYDVLHLSQFLGGSDMAGVVTVAWVPVEVTGNNAIIALACREIVMHPEARLGDIGRGEVLPQGEQAMVQQLVAGVHNLRVNAALAQAMMDPAVGLIQASVEDANSVVEKRILTDAELTALRDTGAVIVDTDNLKESGTVGVFSTAQARTHDFLISGTATNRREVADAFQLPLESLREAVPPSNQIQHVSLIAVSGEIDSVMAEFLKRQVDRAINAETNTLVFEFDSQGGPLIEAHELAITIARLSDDNIRTIAWIPEEATGEAAIVALACDEIYLGPGAEIGDIRSGDPAESNPESVDHVKRVLGELAEMKGRPVAMLRAMAESQLPIFEVRNRNSGVVSYMTDENIQLSGGEWIEPKLVPGSGDGRLRLDGQLATQFQIADAQVQSFEALQDRLGLPLDVMPLRLEKTWVDDLVFTLNRPEAVMLMVFVGIIAIYLELHFTTGIMALLAAICFALFFWSKVMGGTAGQLEVILFLIGLVCIGLEIFVIPGFGVFGVVGSLMVMASLVMASQTFGNLEPNRDLYDAGKTFATFGASVLAVIVMAMALSRFLPRIPFLSDLILTPPGVNELQNPDEPRLKRELMTPTSELVGQSGSALSMLRPSGKAVIGGKVIDVFSEGPLIAEGAAIEVVSATANKITVRQVAQG